MSVSMGAWTREIKVRSSTPIKTFKEMAEFALQGKSRKEKSPG